MSAEPLSGFEWRPEEAPTEGPTTVPVSLDAPKPPPKLPSPKKPAKIRIKTRPEELEDPKQEEILTPSNIKGWSTSLVAHVVILILLALVVLNPARRRQVELDTRLAGDPHGSEFGDQLKGGLGISDPLVGPLESAPEIAPTSPTLTTADSVTLQPELSAAIKPKTGESRGQNGVALTGTGQAGSGDGFGIAKFGHGGEVINNVEVKVGNPQFTLIWDSRADIDLHVIEPGGSHLYWADRNGHQGGELDVDDVDGFGPENIYWGGGIDKGNGPPGEYKWYVHYYGSIGEAPPTKWKVRLKHNGKYVVYEGKLTYIGQKSRLYSFGIKESDLTTTEPESVAKAKTEEAPNNLGAAAASAFGRSVKRTARDPDGWVTVSPTGGDFLVLMPEEPIVERRTTSTSVGDLDVRSYFVDRGEGGYSLTYTDFPEQAAGVGPEALASQAVKGTVDAIGGKLLKDEPITVDGHPGRAVEIEVPDAVVGGGGVSKARVIAIGRRVFTASVTGTRAFVGQPGTAKFLESFKPTGGP